MMFCRISNTNTYKKVYVLDSNDFFFEMYGYSKTNTSYAILTQEMLLIYNSMNVSSKM